MCDIFQFQRYEKASTSFNLFNYNNISAHWRFTGKIRSQFKSEAKTKGYSGHNLRVALWDTYYVSDKSQIAFYFNTTFLPFLYGLAYTSIFYLFVQYLNLTLDFHPSLNPKKKEE